MKHVFILLTSVLLSICLFIILPGNIYYLATEQITTLPILKTVALVMALSMTVLISFKSYKKIKMLSDKEIKLHIMIIGVLEYIKFFMALTFMTPPDNNGIYNYNAGLITYCVFLVIQILVYIAYTKGLFSEDDNVTPNDDVTIHKSE
jgi:hypothetical protein